VVAGSSLAKKDIFGASDPYVRIDLNTINGDVNIDSVLTKTKKKVKSLLDIRASIISSKIK
jgi:E3 ubiquitin-protein ligase NEDD4